MEDRMQHLRDVTGLTLIHPHEQTSESPAVRFMDE